MGNRNQIGLPVTIIGEKEKQVSERQTMCFHLWSNESESEFAWNRNYRDSLIILLLHSFCDYYIAVIMHFCYV